MELTFILLFLSIVDEIFKRLLGRQEAHGFGMQFQT